MDASNLLQGGYSSSPREAWVFQRDLELWASSPRVVLFHREALRFVDKSTDASAQAFVALDQMDLMEARELDLVPDRLGSVPP